MANSNLIRSLNDIFNDPDVDDMLKAPAKHRPVVYDTELDGFREINAWVESHNGSEPQKLRDPSQLKQRKLASRLKGIREDPNRRKHLLPYDTFGLLRSDETQTSLEEAVRKEKSNFSSLDDILGDDSILFSDTSAQLIDGKLFDTKIYKDIQREQENRPELVSQRKMMANFSEFEPMFKKVQAEITSGKRQLRAFKNYEILRHHFYVLKGQLLYVDEIGAEIELSNNSHRKKDARLHVIYDNGTDNHPLRNGLAASLYGRQGRVVSEPENHFILNADDQVTGFIYVLKSLSTNEQVVRIQQNNSLYKVGFTAGSIRKRIANAENESTYLYAPVQIIEEMKVVNLNAEALETALHHAMAEYQLKIDITAANGRLIHPREWFVIDLTQIEEIAADIISKLRMQS
ncbi:GIY-YIG nuclease family protein [Lactiplantibacillus pentosus]|uniref:GIY-YIG nuclease family protein n=3 Tax=Lactiplantibacillus pentosus TaxID=1589 RepID=A0AAX6LI24_LACPE|nr:GIY-YIG nuclease family protein [Lactiplantibacillus pentosus]AYJ41205.1 GIY-YIG nuclease family protein [Lactiplantibacillus pentosus]KRK27116.1 yeec-like protein [Lactiplantibacillus pentosus DSM 20314]MBU7496138.1 GIY-YIG nuclease family protein [Lactiplantibacillus pentosus]MCC3161410.1 GIY-YIG nuclease family protein [Lactiplantibacillus pentosus]MCJ8186983.1 GIY-YIG nuclease family protein [Lactiplantibacillus pentosus]